MKLTSKNEIIGLDLDSVIGDTDAALVKYLKEEHNFDLDLSTMSDYKLENYPGISQEVADQAMIDIYNGNVLFKILPFEYTKTAIDKLYDAGFRVMIITSRPADLHDMTLKWLDMWSLRYNDIHYIETINKHKVINDFDIKAFVDDRYEAIDGIVNNCGALEYGLYMIKCPWNWHYNHPHMTRVNTLLEAVNKIVDRRYYEKSTNI
jgi:uncharacterized HAD superfamily protein